MERVVPQYVSRSVPVPLDCRVPWYKSTFPTYAGIFLWVGFYLKLAEPTIGYADISLCLWGLLVAGLLCFGLYYYVPAMLGMQTGHPLYVVGTSTFGTIGGYLIPGLMMGLLQIGWVAVVGAVSADFIMKGLNQTSKVLSSVIIVIWIYSLGWVAIKGIHYVGRVAKFMNWIPLIMILIVFYANKGGIANYRPAHHEGTIGFLNVLTIVIGYFATAGAAGADFGMNNGNRKDVLLGGIFGIVGGALIAGGLPILSVAGYLGRGTGPQSYDYTAAISSVGALAPVMFFLFAIASMVPTCFSSFIASNSFATMLPRIPRTASTLAALTVSVLLAVTGVANNLVGFFSLVAASFGPICGAMVADYVSSGRRWSGPRLGINWAGCIAWIVGFLVGIPEHLPAIPAAWVKADNPSGLYSFIVGFLVYLVLAKTGLRPPVVEKAITTTDVQPLQSRQRRVSMSKQLWTSVDDYITDLFVPFDPVMQEALATSEDAGLPSISVAPNEGKLLMLLAQLCGARKILEIGTLGGYSTIWLARGVASGGSLITLEASAKHAEIARLNIARAGLTDIVEVRVGPAGETLPQLAAEGRGPFDLIFIDADKEGYPEYLAWALKLARPGTLIIADNVIRDGQILDPASSDPRIQGTRRFNQLLANEPRVRATVVQTVGRKGHDGMAIAIVIAQ